MYDESTLSTVELRRIIKHLRAMLNRSDELIEELEGQRDAARLQASFAIQRAHEVGR